MTFTGHFFSSLIGCVEKEPLFRNRDLRQECLSSCGRLRRAGILAEGPVLAERELYQQTLLD